MLVTNSGKIGLQILVTCTRPLGNPVDGARVQAMSSAPYYACQAPGLAVDGFWLPASGLETLLSLCCPRSRLFPLHPSRTWPFVIEFGKGQAFGGFVHGMARGEKTAQGSCFQAAELGLAIGIYSSQKRRRKKGSGHSVFFRKNNHSNSSLHSCTYSSGRKLPEVGTGGKQSKQGVNCTLVFSQCSAACSPLSSPKSLESCVWVGLLGWCVVFFCLSDEGCSAR